MGVLSAESNVRYLDPSSFIDAVAPTEEGFNRISRQQYSICESSERASERDSALSMVAEMETDNG